jgi:hypothetical protein
MSTACSKSCLTLSASPARQTRSNSACAIRSDNNRNSGPLQESKFQQLAVRFGGQWIVGRVPLFNSADRMTQRGREGRDGLLLALLRGRRLCHLGGSCCLVRRSGGGDGSQGGGVLLVIVLVLLNLLLREPGEEGKRQRVRRTERAGRVSDREITFVCVSLFGDGFGQQSLGLSRGG